MQPRQLARLLLGAPACCKTQGGTDGMVVLKGVLGLQPLQLTFCCWCACTLQHSFTLRRRLVPELAADQCGRLGRGPLPPGEGPGFGALSPAQSRQAAVFQQLFKSYRSRSHAPLTLLLSNTRPTPQVLTHGFVLDEKGMKMSKSLGNTTTRDHGGAPLSQNLPKYRSRMLGNPGRCPMPGTSPGRSHRISRMPAEVPEMCPTKLPHGG